MAEASQKGEQVFRGIPVSAGVCRGRLLVIDRSRHSIGKRELTETELQDEISRLERGLVQCDPYGLFQDNPVSEIAR